MAPASDHMEYPPVRAEVSSVILQAGYTARHDGANGWLWANGLKDGTTLAIRFSGGSANSLDGDPGEHDWTVERYGPDNAYVNVGTGWTLTGAIAAAKRLPRPFDQGGNPLQECHLTMGEALSAAAARVCGPASGPHMQAE